MAIMWKQRERVGSLYMTDKKQGQRKGDAPWGDKQTCIGLPFEIVELRASGLVRKNAWLIILPCTCVNFHELSSWR